MQLHITLRSALISAPDGASRLLHTQRLAVGSSDSLQPPHPPKRPRLLPSPTVKPQPQGVSHVVLLRLSDQTAAGGSIRHRRASTQTCTSLSVRGCSQHRSLTLPSTSSPPGARARRLGRSGTRRSASKDRPPPRCDGKAAASSSVVQDQRADDRTPHPVYATSSNATQMFSTVRSWMAWNSASEHDEQNTTTCSSKKSAEGSMARAGTVQHR